MKTLNEYKAEIFERSNARIKQRQKRGKQVLAVCFSFVLCVTVGSVLLLSTLPFEKHKDPGEGADMYNGSSTSGSLVCSYTEVRIAGGENGSYVKHTDQATVTRLFDVLQTLYGYDLLSDASDGIAEEEKQENNASKHTESGSSPKDCYIITFSAADGAQMVYKLNGTLLINADTDASCIISQAQLEELLDLFDLS